MDQASEAVAMDVVKRMHRQRHMEGMVIGYLSSMDRAPIIDRDDESGRFRIWEGKRSYELTLTEVTDEPR